MTFYANFITPAVDICVDIKQVVKFGGNRQNRPNKFGGAPFYLIFVSKKAIMTEYVFKRKMYDRILK